MNIFLPKDLYKGIISYYLKKGKRSSILIFAESNSLYPVEWVIDRNVGSHWGSPSSSDFGQSLYLSIEKRPILVSSYSMISQTGQNYYPRSWDFSVSNDNETWIPSHSVNNSDILEPNKAVLFKLEHPIIAKYFKWTNRGISGHNSYAFYINEIEIFGSLNPFREPTCRTKQQKTYHLILLMLLTCK